ncbi:ABC transporter ATP-binding protein [Fictibacillus aquaticus]|uniref:ABC transporter ATP-binding protein n=1 Tax=Fictibacillus aquaticus TaxID=2021314 RepID=A0A235FEA9_9BACL|nr:ABC transporter ATP-binding protein [Fictibacillus aquaticus]OYD59274.1 ABC transporter ATP-binding protein [Fictibacillus aquaticus]
MNAIEIRHVKKAFGKTEILTDIDMIVQKQTIFGLLGPSGAGKTTLVKMIAGIQNPTAGSIIVNQTMMPSFAMMEKIGYMAQSDALYSELSALENLDFFASLYGLKGKKKKERIHAVLEIVNLADHAKKTVSSYSGGMKRRLSLAAALLHEPEILILDEPTVGIDPVLRASIWRELRCLRQNGTTILVTTHVMDEAEKCDQLAMMREGRLISTGTPEDLKDGSKTLEEAFLYFGGASNEN